MPTRAIQSVTDEKGPPARRGGDGSGRKGERGIALVVVLLLLATTTLIGIGAMTQAVSDMKIASNENCSNRTLNAAEAGIEDGMSVIFGLKEDGGARFNTGNTDYNGNPLTYWNVYKSTSLGNCGDLGPKATDAQAACSVALTSANPDGTLQAATEEGGQFDYFYEVRRISPSIGEKKGVACGKAAIGEQIGEGSEIQCRDYIAHSIGRGCGTTQDLSNRTRKTERTTAAQDYSS